MSVEETFRRVLAARLPAGPAWAAWIDGTVAELAGSVPADPRLEQFRALCDRAATDRYEWDGEKVVFLSDLRAVLDAPVEAP